MQSSHQIHSKPHVHPTDPSQEPIKERAECTLVKHGPPRDRLRCFLCGRLVAYDEILDGQNAERFDDGIAALLELLDATTCSEHSAQLSYLRIKKGTMRPISIDVVRCCPRAWARYVKLFERSFTDFIIGPKDAFAYWGFEVDGLAEKTGHA